MTLLQLLKEIRDMGAIGDRVRKIKCGDIELELDPPETASTKTVEIPFPQEHGTHKTDEEARLLADIEQRHAFYGAAQGAIPSDYVPNS